MKTKKILHITNNSVFAKGYIEFMNSTTKRYEHFFYVMRKGAFDGNGLDNVEIVKKDKLCYILRLYNKSKKYDKVIFTGVWNSFVIIALSFFPKSFFKKFYLQFWGGDFYELRSELEKGLKTKIVLHFKKKLIKSSAGLIFLLPEEYRQFVAITGIEKENYVAPMPMSPSESKGNYDYYRELEEKLLDNLKEQDEEDYEYRVMVGHSPAKECCHFDIFERLQKFKDNNIRIICPLSYGVSDYANEVAEKGKDVFDSKFEPIFKFMRIDKYRDFLATIDLAILVMNRQQGLGNIYMLLAAGKKVILRRGTSMYEWFAKEGFKIYDESELEKSFAEVCDFSLENRKYNMEKMQQFYKDSYEDALKKWEYVFTN